MAVTYAYALI